MTKNPWLYFHGDYDGEILLQKLVIEEWNGILPYDPEAVSKILDKTDKTMVYLVNGDAIDVGDISYENSVILAETTLGEIDVPLNRVGFIDFSGLPYQEAKRERNDVRLTLQNGDIVTLDLSEWGEQLLRGSSQNVSQIMVKEDALQKIEFNIYR